MKRQEVDDHHVYDPNGEEQDEEEDEGEQEIDADDIEAQLITVLERGDNKRKCQPFQYIGQWIATGMWTIILTLLTANLISQFANRITTVVGLLTWCEDLLCGFLIVLALVYIMGVAKTIVIRRTLDYACIAVSLFGCAIVCATVIVYRNDTLRVWGSHPAWFASTFVCTLVGCCACPLVCDACPCGRR